MPSKHWTTALRRLDNYWFYTCFIIDSCRPPWRFQLEFSWKIKNLYAIPLFLFFRDLIMVMFLDIDKFLTKRDLMCLRHSEWPCDKMHFMFAEISAMSAEFTLSSVFAKLTVVMCTEPLSFLPFSSWLGLAYSWWNFGTFANFNSWRLLFTFLLKPPLHLILFHFPGYIVRNVVKNGGWVILKLFSYRFNNQVTYVSHIRIKFWPKVV